MIEVHPDPPNAAVDPLQSVDYEEFEDMMITTRKIAALVGKSKFGRIN